MFLEAVTKGPQGFAPLPWRSMVTRNAGSLASVEPRWNPRPDTLSTAFDTPGGVDRGRGCHGVPVRISARTTTGIRAALAASGDITVESWVRWASPATGSTDFQALGGAGSRTSRTAHTLASMPDGIPSVASMDLWSHPSQQAPVTFRPEYPGDGLCLAG